MDATKGDFRPKDSAPAGKGEDLSKDPVLPFNDDITGQPRGKSWSIGAFEVKAK